MDVKNRQLYQFQLSPTGSQKDHLTLLFAGPELLLDLLKNAKNLPKNSLEIGLFLLKNKVKLFPYICRDIHNNINVLTDIIHKFVKSDEKNLRVDFLNNCSVSKDCLFYFPIKNLGLIKSSDICNIADWKKFLNGRRYDRAFSIIKRNNKFFAEIEIEGAVTSQNKTNSRSKIATGTQLKNSKNASPKKRKKDKSKSYTGIIATDNKGSDISYSEQKVINAIAFAKGAKRDRAQSSFDEGNSGSIWTVSGGLPSLGRHR